MARSNGRTTPSVFATTCSTNTNSHTHTHAHTHAPGDAERANYRAQRVHGQRRTGRNRSHGLGKQAAVAPHPDLVELEGLKTTPHNAHRKPPGLARRTPGR
jgi:hypothetical protein